MQSRYLVVALLFIILITILTNHIEPHGTELTDYAAGDANSYYAIAEAAPGLPEDTILFHHAQRMFFPYLFGLISRFSGVPLGVVFDGSTWIGLILVMISIYALAAAMGLGWQKTLLLAVLLFSAPWSIRYYITFHGMAFQLLFHVGLALVLIGLIKVDPFRIVFALILMVLTRQTALLILPGLFLWVLCDSRWQSRSLRNRLGWIVIFALVTLVFYQATMFLAAQYGDSSSTTSHHLVGFLMWFRNPPPLIEYVNKLPRIVITFVIPLVLFVPALRNSAVTWRTMPPTIWFALLMVAGISSQPFLGGPITGNNFQRLMSFGYVSVLYALAEIWRQESTLDRGRLWHLIVVVVLIFVGSFHHVYSIIGPNLAWVLGFAVLHFTVAGLLFGFTWFVYRPSLEVAQEN